VAEKTRRKERVGVVVSNKMQKTVIVAVETFKRHRIYKKILRKTRRFKVHDESNACSLGDLVRIVETRPLSKEKRWRVGEVLVRGEVAEVAPKEIGTQLIEELMPKAPPSAMLTAPVEEAEAVEESAAPVQEVEAVQEPEPAAAEAEAVEEPAAPVQEVEAVQEPEAVAAEAEVVKEPETPVQVVEGEVEGQPAAEAEQEPEMSEEAPEAEEEK
jgi:small subunit ribosomal protein S17